MGSGDAELGQSFCEKASWQEGKELVRAVPPWVSASEGCQDLWVLNGAAHQQPWVQMEDSTLSRQWDKNSSKEEVVWLCCFMTSQNVSFYFESCFLWFAARDQTVSLDFFPRHTVLGNFTFTFECKLFESVSSLAWNSKIKSKWDGFLWNEKGY